MPDANHDGLSLTHVTLRRGRRTVLDDISVSLGSGAIIAIVGPNGAGKTTLLEAVLGAGRCLSTSDHSDPERRSAGCAGDAGRAPNDSKVLFDEFSVSR